MVNVKTTARIDAKHSGITKNDPESVLQGLKSPVLVFCHFTYLPSTSGFCLLSLKHENANMSKIHQDNRYLIDLRFPIKGLTELESSVPKINHRGNSFKRCSVFGFGQLRKALLGTKRLANFEPYTTCLCAQEFAPLVTPRRGSEPLFHHFHRLKWLRLTLDSNITVQLVAALQEKLRPLIRVVHMRCPSKHSSTVWFSCSPG